jgi:Tol biopolymer transport system component
VKALGDGIAQGISPDGREVLVVTNDGQRLEIYPMGLGTRRTIELRQLERVRGAAWFPDGQRILACGNEAAQPPRCYVNDGERGAWRAATRNGTGGIVSPDGREVIVLDFLEGPSRYLLDGSLVPLPIPGVLPSDIPVAWSRDGRSAYFTDRLEMPGRIRRVDLATGKSEVKYTFGLANLSGVRRWLSPAMAGDADVYAYGYYRELSTLYVVEHSR